MGRRFTPTRARFDPSLQETQAIRPAVAGTPRPAAPPGPPPAPTTTVIEAQPPLAPAVRPRSRTNPQFSRGPHGCILGVIAVILICSVAGAMVWLVGRPLLTNAIESEVDEGIATQVAAIERLPVEATGLSAGTLRITEEEINDGIAGQGASFDPVENPRVAIEPGEISIGFDLLGSHSTYRGDLEVRDGRLTVVDARVDGQAGRFLDEDAFAEILEDQFAALLARFDLTPTGVDIGNGVLVIETEEA